MTNKSKICPICQKEGDFKFIQDYKNKDGEWFLYECLKCEVQFWMPFKNPGSSWYQEEDTGYLTKDTIKPKIEYIYKLIFKKIKNFSGIKILDLGCGTGDFIAELHKRGCEVWGVDFNKNAIRFIKKYFKLENVYAMSFDDFFKLPNLPKFDVITFLGVIEHLDNPLKFIKNLGGLLKKDGMIILHTPSRERIWINSLTGDFPPQHLTRWNENAICNLFLKINFKIINVCYVWRFKDMFDILSGKISFGVAGKILKTSKNEEISNKKFSQLIKNALLTRLTKMIPLLVYIKNYLLLGIPSLILFLISKIISTKKQKKGTMLICLKNIS